jgi:membrane associated rhomboid family serine protease
VIPLRDVNPTQRRPYVVYTIIAVNVAVWLYEFMLGPDGMQQFVVDWGVVPKELLSGQQLLEPLTSMFMHGGWMHIIGNMWFLWVFGDNVEDDLGRVKFSIFYLLTGLAAVAAQVLVDPASGIPMVGASGAISGVLAGYVLLHPRARVLTLIPIFVFIQFVELPAFLFIFVWFGLQVLNGYLAIGSDMGGVAWFAHIGGFVAGIVLMLMFRPFVRKRPPTAPTAPRRAQWQDDADPWRRRDPRW